MNPLKTYTNPVFNRSFPDPFVLKHRGVYFAYCTGFSTDGRVFGVMRSNNLVDWTSLSGGMEPLATGEPFYWAPEVTYYNGKFYLYYSTGNETLMSIRVAIADRPDGEFVDAGIALTKQDFAIDAHVFRDDDQNWYMFYATDFLEHSHIGTGTVVDRMIDPFTLAGNPRPVTRAKYDWQVYDPHRKEKGGVRWHTVEGPFVLKRKGIYYQMFSGGNWQNVTYGVSFAVAENIESADEWPQYSDGENVLPILRTVPGHVIGPGHNSVIVGPNNRELYCVYHRWVDGERVLAVDRMDFSGDGRIFVIGPTDTPQPMAFGPQISESLTELSDGETRPKNGQLAKSRLATTGATENEIIFDTPGGSFRCEVWIRFDANWGPAGLRLYGGGVADVIQFDHQNRSISFSSENRECFTSTVPDDLDFSCLHHVRLDVDHRFARIFIDGIETGPACKLAAAVPKIGLFSEALAHPFSAFSLTAGFEELFEVEDLGVRGWKVFADDDGISIVNRQLRVDARGQSLYDLTKVVPVGDHELAINVRRERQAKNNGIISFGCGAMVDLSYIDGFKLRTQEEVFDLPVRYDPHEFHQFRIVSSTGKSRIFVNENLIGSVDQGSVSGQISIRVQGMATTFDMIRYTVL